MVDDFSNSMDYNLLNLPTDDTVNVYDLDTGCRYGVSKSNHKYINFCLSPDENLVIVGDVCSRDMNVYVNHIQSTVETSYGTIDLNSNGRRWEGSISNALPYGYGILYDEDGNKSYEGFMISHHRVCFGSDYYDIGCIQYQGSYYRDQKWGLGTLYDRNHVVEYQGVWKNDISYSPLFDGRTIDSFTECVTIPDHSFVATPSLLLGYWLRSLKCLTIGDDSFTMVRDLSLDGLQELESIVIGKNCFAFTKNWDDVRGSLRTDGSCRIVNNPKIKSIRIGDYSFSDYHTLTMGNLPSLQSVDIGEMCFYRAPIFSLRSRILSTMLSFRFPWTRVHCNGEWCPFLLSFYRIG